ncbi:MAG: hypothetical protein HYR74_02525 [Candidatus Eisenbacteria bacterium]|nr:hypothetical protein [Candidatus Eisenbacteria bacterium]
MNPRTPWIAALCAVLCITTAALARDAAPAQARGGFDLARDAARAWSEDATLTYVENDEPLTGDGAAPRWGYLFYSKALDASRVYSVREGRIVVAENLDIKFEAPPVADPWIDSGAALTAAEQDAGRTFRRDHAGTLTTMLLMRGALESNDPDETTWMLVYASPSAPSLFVVVDAASGKVRRTWRG